MPASCSATGPACGSVLVRDGLIAEIDGRPSSTPGAEDLDGDLLVPGPSRCTPTTWSATMPRPRSTPAAQALQSHDAELAACGITTVFDAIGVGDLYDEGFRSKDQSGLLGLFDNLELPASCAASTWCTSAASCWRPMHCNSSSPLPATAACS